LWWWKCVTNWVFWCRSRLRVPDSLTIDVVRLARLGHLAAHHWCDSKRSFAISSTDQSMVCMLYKAIPVTVCNVSQDVIASIDSLCKRQPGIKCAMLYVVQEARLFKGKGSGWTKPPVVPVFVIRLAHVIFLCRSCRCNCFYISHLATLCP
jgi:hypothetical protein